MTRLLLCVLNGCSRLVVGFGFGTVLSFRSEIRVVLGLDSRIAALSSLKGVSPFVFSALPCKILLQFLTS